MIAMDKKTKTIALGIIIPVVAAIAISNYDLSGFNLLGSLDDSVKKVGGFDRIDPIDRLGLTRAASSVRASSIELTARDTLIFYDRDSGKVMELSLLTGQEETITQNILPNFISSIWGRAQRDVISLFSDIGGIQKRYYNFTTKESFTLDPDIGEISFSPTGDKIAYFRRGDDSGVYIARPDGLEPKLVLKTRLENVIPYWIEDTSIYITTRDSETGLDSLYRVATTGELFLIAKDSKIDGLSFSPNRMTALYRSGDSVQSIDLETLAKKKIDVLFMPNQCSWLSGVEIVCPIERDIGSSIDTVNLDTLVAQTIKDIPSSLKAIKVFSSFSGKVLAIQDSYSGKIFLVNR